MGVVLWLLAIVGAVIVEELLRRFAVPKISAWWEQRSYNKIAPEYVEQLLNYQTHLRDVGKALGRIRGEPAERVIPAFRTRNACAPLL